MRSPDSELYKDKIEISLDGRQVFYLFFGGAVIACLVFVLGVMVGRRVEARAHVDRAAGTTAARDPLAALDRLDAPDGDDMSFRNALGGGGAGSQVDDAVAAIDQARAAAGAAGAADVPAAAPATDAATRKQAAADEAARKQQAADEAARKQAADEAAARQKADEAAAKKAAAAAAKQKAEEAAVAAKKAAEDAQAGKFTLQLSSFQDRNEAESFLADVRNAGYKAYLVQADVENKGRFYRVRLGSYGDYQAALDAKAEFERKVNKIAYVTRL
ncbi:MAG: SPOR domain-containing protein [Kofleriaceae bacterium]|nr:SPOR domain-containing protein [Kofleriaceae bacterium]